MRNSYTPCVICRWRRSARPLHGAATSSASGGRTRKRCEGAHRRWVRLAHAPGALGGRVGREGRPACLYHTLSVSMCMWRVHVYASLTRLRAYAGARHPAVATARPGPKRRTTSTT